jgi:hypothetical protein
MTIRKVIINRFAFHSILLFFSFLLSQQCYSREYTLAEIERVENKAIANRERFKSWHVRVSHAVVKLGPSVRDPDYGDHRGKFVGMELFQSENGDSFREERSFLLNGITSKHLNVLGKEWIYRFGTDTLRREGTTEDIPVLNMRDRGRDTNIVRPYDARTLGFMPGAPRSIALDLRSYIGSPRRTDIFMADDLLNGEHCYKISFSNLAIQTRNTTSFWISPSRDYNPIKFELVFPDIKKITIVDIALEKHHGYWFPSLIHSVTTTEGSIDYEHKTQIEVVSLNEKMDTNLFNEKGLGLPVGTLVFMDPEPYPETFIWDGEKIVDTRGVAPLAPIIGDIPNYATRYLLMAMGLAMICMFFLLKFFEPLKKKREVSGG